MSSPDVRDITYQQEIDKVHVFPNPFWPPAGFDFPVSPYELNNWADDIYFASEFFQELED